MAHCIVPEAEAILDNVYVHNMFNNNFNRGGISYDR